ncbi:hypothetical protein HELRODRAFT_160807 [Helobdella robusta]|uniref:Apple domain-containing protein n=1 Tax=Helobdella robusta TaxID=6412 RepID=T1EQR1_HELRO|nr:hypothetical protein HELRODRAFT_160807 [Helobdella robusta]ESO06617.1 hypothetical protein HELRODRAFT_160807 [Helobdella robusta]
MKLNIQHVFFLYTTFIFIDLCKQVQNEVCWDKFEDRAIKSMFDNYTFKYRANHTLDRCKEKCMERGSECEYLVYLDFHGICFIQVIRNTDVTLIERGFQEVHQKVECTNKTGEEKTDTKANHPTDEKVEKPNSEQIMTKVFKSIARVFINVSKDFENFGGLQYGSVQTHK